MGAERERLGKTEVYELIREAQRGSDLARERLIQANTGLVKSLALKFTLQGYELDDLMQIGFSGRSIGVMLNWLLEQVMEETLPNERGVLLDWAQRVWNESWQNS